MVMELYVADSDTDSGVPVGPDCDVSAELNVTAGPLVRQDRILCATATIYYVEKRFLTGLFTLLTNDTLMEYVLNGCRPVMTYVRVEVFDVEEYTEIKLAVQVRNIGKRRKKVVHSPRGTMMLFGEAAVNEGCSGSRAKLLATELTW